MTGRRERILHAAAGLFAEHGFHGVSIDQLGSAVGLSGPALYRYFPGKEAILTAILVDISELLLAGARQRREQPSAGRSLLGDLIDFHVDFALDHPELIAVHFRDLGSLPESGMRRVRRLQSDYVEIWVQAVLLEYPGTDPRRARSAVHAAFGLMNSTPHSARLSRPLMDSLLRGMAAAALREGAGF